MDFTCNANATGAAASADEPLYIIVIEGSEQVVWDDIIDTRNECSYVVFHAVEHRPSCRERDIGVDICRVDVNRAAPRLQLCAPCVCEACAELCEREARVPDESV